MIAARVFWEYLREVRSVMACVFRTWYVSSQTSEMENWWHRDRMGTPPRAELSDLSLMRMRTGALTFHEQLCNVNSVVLNRQVFRSVRLDCLSSVCYCGPQFLLCLSYHINSKASSYPYTSPPGLAQDDVVEANTARACLRKCFRSYHRYTNRIVFLKNLCPLSSSWQAESLAKNHRTI